MGVGMDDSNGKSSWFPGFQIFSFALTSCFPALLIWKPKSDEPFHAFECFPAWWVPIPFAVSCFPAFLTKVGGRARVVKWQTRTFEGRMPKGMRVQVPPRAPSICSFLLRQIIEPNIIAVSDSEFLSVDVEEFR